jgi:hypothetical protein
MSISTPSRAIAFAFAIGIAGGLGFVAVLTTTGPRSATLLLPYPAIVAATVAYVVSHRIAAFATRFWISLVAFVVSNVIGMIYVITVANPRALNAPLSHHVFSFSAMVVIGMAVSAIVAVATPVRAVPH